ncbi:hypothetical protein Slin15195_G067760 [Septoria linicola]|uniref:Uncharacterized protein n=1 Tax=Septoria linicola TaxID=215465 RepID=A0A9Q9AWY2_9PEZI|nr:hypothetical protein Slin14017_G100500 [Septoria linicola]USW53457.1 hypothetical protein Slin15195_G067760 [Septoria linicola]
MNSAVVPNDTVTAPDCFTALKEAGAKRNPYQWQFDPKLKLPNHFLPDLHTDSSECSNPSNFAPHAATHNQNKHFRMRPSMNLTSFTSHGDCGLQPASLATGSK